MTDPSEMVGILASSAWPPVIAAAIGATAAISIAVVTLWYNRNKERQSLAAAVGGEISALMSLLKIRNYLEILGHYKKTVTASAQTPPILYSFSVTQDFFTIFHENADKIGHLPPEVAKGVAEFYIMAKSAVEDFRVIDSRKYLDWPSGDLTQFLTDAIEVLELARDKAQAVIPMLDAESKRLFPSEEPLSKS